MSKVIEKKGGKKTKEKKGGKPKKVSTRISKSGKYTSIRHMMEQILAKTPDITSEKVIPMVKKEYPNSAFKPNHLAWYRGKIVKQGKTKNR